MTSIEDVIAGQNHVAIKRKRSSVQSMITIVSKSLTKLLTKENDSFNHATIDRVRVVGEHAKLVKYHQNFDAIHEAYIEHRDTGEDEAAEAALMEEDEKQYNDVVDKIYGVLGLYSEYEKSYSLSSSAESSSVNVEPKLNEDKISVNTENKSQLRAAVVKAELTFQESYGLLNTAKLNVSKMVEFAKDVSSEKLVQDVLSSVHLRSLPFTDSKDLLTDRLEKAHKSAMMWFNAVEAESGFEAAKETVTFDKVKEDAEIQHFVSILNLLINAKADHNPTVVVTDTVRSNAVTSVTPIKVKLNTPRFSGKSRDFAIYKKEFLDIVVPGRSAAEIGALLREGLNVKEKNLLRNNDMCNYTEALDILQAEYGKPELVINDVNVELDKLKPPSGEKADQGFISFVEKLENICRDMETVKCSSDLKNGHMINVLVKKLPPKVAQEWAKFKQKEKIGIKSSEEIFTALMDFLKSEKEITKDLLSKQESSSEKSRSHTCYVTGQTFLVHQTQDKQIKSADKKLTKPDPLCLACKGSKNPQDAKHWTTNCDKWKSLKLPDRKKLVRCQRHIQAGNSHDPAKCHGDNMSRWYNNGHFLWNVVFAVASSIAPNYVIKTEL